MTTYRQYRSSSVHIHQHVLLQRLQKPEPHPPVQKSIVAALVRDQVADRLAEVDSRVGGDLVVPAAD